MRKGVKWRMPEFDYALRDRGIIIQRLSGLSYTKISLEYGISYARVWQIARRELWRFRVFLGAQPQKSESLTELANSEEFAWKVLGSRNNKETVAFLCQMWVR